MGKEKTYTMSRWAGWEEEVSSGGAIMEGFTAWKGKIKRENRWEETSKGE